MKVNTLYVGILTGYILYTAVCLPLSANAGAETILDAEEIVRRIETQYTGKTSYATARMHIVTEHWSRELSMESWSEGRDKFLTRILSPKKEEGTATLKIDDDIWNYLPKIDRLMKIPSSLMGDGWMGSHLTNDDLVKEDKIEELYSLTVEKADGNSATIVGIPKPDAAVVWGKIEYQADIEKMIPIQILYYDEDNILVRTILFDTIKQISGRWIPMRMVVKPEDAPDELTEFIYDNLEFDVALEKNKFSIQSLRR